MRKSKISSLIVKKEGEDEKTYLKRVLRYKSGVLKDLKKGVELLKKCQAEEREIGALKVLPYFMYLNYFDDGDPFLVIGTHTALRKQFIALSKNNAKTNISYGTVHLDGNDILKFVPQKNGMNVKPKPIINACKKDIIKKSDAAFWQKRTVNNTIIAQLPKKPISKEPSTPLNKEDIAPKITQKNDKSIDLSVGKEILERWVNEGIKEFKAALQAKPRNYEKALDICTTAQSDCEMWLMNYKDASVVKQLGKQKMQKKFKKMQLQVGGFIVKITDLMDKDQLLGDLSNATIVDNNVTYDDAYQLFKKFVEKDYNQNKSTRTAEYYAAVMGQLDAWIVRLDKDWEKMEDKSAQDLYENMRREILLFKEDVKVEADTKQQEQSSGKEEDVAAILEGDIRDLLKAYQLTKDDYEASIKEAAIRRLLDKLDELNSYGERVDELTKGLEAALWQRRIN